MNSLMYTSEYEKMFHSEDKLWWYVGLRKTLSYFLNKYADRSAAILDAGCGTGKNMQYLYSIGYQNIVGLDYSNLAVNYSKLRGLENVSQGSITDIKHPNDTFDLIYCMDVIGSLANCDRRLAVDELYRVLKPGGILICHTAAIEAFRSQHDDVANIKLRFNKNQLKELFTRKGTRTLKLSYRVFLLSPLLILFKLIKRKTKGLNRTAEAKSDQILFPFGINWVLLKLQLIENWFLRYVGFPIGTSLLIIIRKN